MACFLMPLLRGIPVVALDPFEWVLRPTLLMEAMATHRATLAWLPNFAFHHILGSLRPGDHWELGSVRAIINCSEPCKADTFSHFAQRFQCMGLGLDKLHTCYALAENVFAATQSDLRQTVKVRRIQPGPMQRQGFVREADPGGEALPFVSCGPPIPGVEIGIHGPGGEPLPEGRVGEVVLSGDCLFSGYFRLPEETRRKCRDGRYFTGDLGFLLAGELYLTGRQEDLLIVYGQNFYAHDVEFAAQGAGGFIPGRAVALSFYHSDLGTEEVVLVAETEGDAPPEGERAIKEAVLSRLGLTLRQVLFVPKGWLVKTTSGKISRKENQMKFLELKEPRHEPV
jgi:acyl-CoA synthetase (AMP-forming)/AMP-acid ligase II